MRIDDAELNDFECLPKTAIAVLFRIAFSLCFAMPDISRVLGLLVLGLLGFLRINIDMISLIV